MWDSRGSISLPANLGPCKAVGPRGSFFIKENGMVVNNQGNIISEELGYCKFINAFNFEFGTGDGSGADGSALAAIQENDSVAILDLSNNSFTKLTKLGRCKEIMGIGSGATKNVVALQENGDIIFSSVFSYNSASSVHTASAIACGIAHTIALKDGAVLAWGDNEVGQCGIPAAATSGVRAIAGGGSHTIAVKDGAVLAWGWNIDGRCTGTDISGNIIYPDSSYYSSHGSAPVQIMGQVLTGVSAIAGGGAHSIALKAGAVLAWGENSSGQCTIPASALSGVTAIAGGESHTIALKNTGAVLAWGAGTTSQTSGGYYGSEFGQCIIPASALSGVTAIAGGGFHTIALKDGAVLAWGAGTNNPNDFPDYGQCNIPASANSGVSAIAGGHFHTIALKDGAVLAWGDNSSGQCTIPASAQSSVAAIAGGGMMTMFLNNSIDFNDNNRPDSCDINDNPVLDRNSNGLLDTYDCFQNPELDCNHNTLIDQYEIEDNQSLDCDSNNKIDSCDLNAGAYDEDGDGRPDTCQRAKGDLDLSGEIDSSDFSILLLYYGETEPIFGDFDNSGEIDSGDASLMLMNFGLVTWP